ncbi:hypothetical protein C2S52_001114 [Perilla frutescens var. hirtella]|nr:hypothetical protein C2S52_001114 [Perilla frutescens var. hirtella]
MREFLRSIDELAWKSVTEGWKKPTVAKEGKHVEIEEGEWTVPQKNCIALGEPISNEKLVRKVLRSLPRKFAYKVAAIEEAKEIKSMRLDELMGSLRAFEMNLEDEDSSSKKRDTMNNMVLITKNFSRMLKRVNKQSSRRSNNRRQSSGNPQQDRNSNIEDKGNWYFDSGCSRHMTGDCSVVQNLKAYSSDFVTFGDGKRGKVIGKGKLIVEGMPKLMKAMLVDGLIANLISISQLCDDDMTVVFTKESCRVMNKNNDLFMEEKRSADNCYQLHVPTQCSLTCQRTSIEESEISYQKLSHINFRNL